MQLGYDSDSRYSLFSGKDSSFDKMSHVKSNKSKKIAKQQQSKQQKKKKNPKRLKDTQNPAKSIGRKKNNVEEKDNIKESRKFMLFLNMMPTQNPRVNEALNLVGEQNRLATKIMTMLDLDNFPSFDGKKPNFLLHTNTLHSVFKLMKEKQGTISYSKRQVLIMMEVFLQRRNLLTMEVLNYLKAYWNDIIFLVNHQHAYIPEDQDMSGEFASIQSLESNKQKQSNHLQNNQAMNLETDHNKAKVPKKRVKNPRQPSQREQLEQEFRKDPSIAAFEIASYFFACCKLFDLRLSD